MESGYSFEEFFAVAEPRLRRAYAPRLPRDRVADAVAVALEFAWQNWDRVSAMESPTAYLYRVGLSKSRVRRQGFLPTPPTPDTASFEPKLIEGLRRLPRRQREVVWLVDGCGWTHREVGEALHVSESAVRTHRVRALEQLRRTMNAQEG